MAKKSLESIFLINQISKSNKFKLNIKNFINLIYYHLIYHIRKIYHFRKRLSIDISVDVYKHISSGDLLKVTG